MRHFEKKNLGIQIVDEDSDKILPAGSFVFVAKKEGSHREFVMPTIVERIIYDELSPDKLLRVAGDRFAPLTKLELKHQKMLFSGIPTRIILVEGGPGADNLHPALQKLSEKDSFLQIRHVKSGGAESLETLKYLQGKFQEEVNSNSSSSPGHYSFTKFIRTMDEKLHDGSWYLQLIFQRKPPGMFFDLKGVENMFHSMIAGNASLKEAFERKEYHTAFQTLQGMFLNPMVSDYVAVSQLVQDIINSYKSGWWRFPGGPEPAAGHGHHPRPLEEVCIAAPPPARAVARRNDDPTLGGSTISSNHRFSPERLGGSHHDESMTSRSSKPFLEGLSSDEEDEDDASEGPKRHQGPPRPAPVNDADKKPAAKILTKKTKIDFQAFDRMFEVLEEEHNWSKEVLKGNSKWRFVTPFGKELDSKRAVLEIILSKKKWMSIPRIHTLALDCILDNDLKDRVSRLHGKLSVSQAPPKSTGKRAAPSSPVESKRTKKAKSTETKSSRRNVVNEDAFQALQDMLVSSHGWKITKRNGGWYYHPPHAQKLNSRPTVVEFILQDEKYRGSSNLRKVAEACYSDEPLPEVVSLNPRKSSRATSHPSREDPFNKLFELLDSGYGWKRTACDGRHRFYLPSGEQLASKSRVVSYVLNHDRLSKMRDLRQAAEACSSLVEEDIGTEPSNAASSTKDRVMPSVKKITGKIDDVAFEELFQILKDAYDWKRQRRNGGWNYFPPELPDPLNSRPRTVSYVKEAGRYQSDVALQQAAAACLRERSKATSKHCASARAQAQPTPHSSTNQDPNPEFKERTKRKSSEAITNQTDLQPEQVQNERPSYGSWSEKEDGIIRAFVLASIEPFNSWSALAKKLPGRNANQVRERWRDALDPTINREPFTRADDLLIWQGFKDIGRKWAEISRQYFGDQRTDNQIRGRWKTQAFKTSICEHFSFDSDAFDLARSSQANSMADPEEDDDFGDGPRDYIRVKQMISAWTSVEDDIIRSAMKELGGSRPPKDFWKALAEKLPGRCVESIARRWKESLKSPAEKRLPAGSTSNLINSPPWTDDENSIIITDFAKFSGVEMPSDTWSKTLEKLPGRTLGALKHQWQIRLKRRFIEEVGPLPIPKVDGQFSKLEMEMLVSACSGLASHDKIFWENLAKRFPDRNPNQLRKKWYAMKKKAESSSAKKKEVADAQASPIQKPPQSPNKIATKPKKIFGQWSKEEDDAVLEALTPFSGTTLPKYFWASIATQFDGRSEDAVRRRWTTLKPRYEKEIGPLPQTKANTTCTYKETATM